ncbi:MAG: hypothetical protein CMJ18_14335 [Phycisphaeraceae bacterium]|nr:hypothetical protein [Phycisphaeraceae bacterium]
MATRKLTLKQWCAALGAVVPLDLVPMLLGVSAGEIGRSVRRGALRVFTFRADNGRVFRMVRRVDLDRYRRRAPGRITSADFARAFNQLSAGASPN